MSVRGYRLEDILSVMTENCLIIENRLKYKFRLKIKHRLRIENCLINEDSKSCHFHSHNPTLSMAPNRRRPTKKPTGKTAAVKHRAPKEAPAPRELTGRQKEILRVRSMKEAEDVHRIEFIARMKACQEKRDVSIKAYREKCAVERELELKAEAAEELELNADAELGYHQGGMLAEAQLELVPIGSDAI